MKVEYRGKTYKETEFEHRVCNFIKVNDTYTLPQFDNELTKEQIEDIYLSNIKRSTALYMVLPAIFFGALVSIVCLLLVLFKDYLHINVFVFFIFIASLFLFFSLYKIIRIIRKDKCYVSSTVRGNRYNMITNEEHNKILDFIRGN